jgi:hypothetical protein
VAWWLSQWFAVKALSGSYAKNAQIKGRLVPSICCKQD